MITFSIKNPPSGSDEWLLIINDQYYSSEYLGISDSWNFPGGSLQQASLRFLAYGPYGGGTTKYADRTRLDNIQDGKSYVYDFSTDTLSIVSGSGAEGDSGWLKWLGLGIGSLLAIAFVQKWRK